MRTPTAVMHASGVEALRDACEQAGLEVAVPGRQEGDLVVAGIPLRVAARAVAQPLPPPEEPTVVVADQVSAATRTALRRWEVGWFDRRGHLALPMIRPSFEGDVAPAPRREPAAAHAGEPFGRSRAAVEVALDLILAPLEPSGVRELGREVELSPGSISMARSRLADAFLVAPDGRPVLPELFEALVEVWRPRWRGLAADLGELPAASRGWVRTGDIAAALLGAPLAVGSAAPGFYYVETETALQAALRGLGPADGDRAVCWVAVSPSRLALTRAQAAESLAGPGTSGLVVPPQVAALELARDTGRGAAILADWRLEGGSPWRTR